MTIIQETWSYITPCGWRRLLIPPSPGLEVPERTGELITIES